MVYEILADECNKRGYDMEMILSFAAELPKLIFRKTGTNPSTIKPVMMGRSPKSAMRKMLETKALAEVEKIRSRKDDPGTKLARSLEKEIKRRANMFFKNNSAFADAAGVDASVICRLAHSDEKIRFDQICKLAYASGLRLALVKEDAAEPTR